MRLNRTVKTAAGGCWFAWTTATAALVMAALIAADGQAAPQGEQVVKGTATFTRDGSLTTIQAGNNSIINYSSFNVATGEQVRFIQPSATSRVLNRINSATPSRIDGTLTANGIVYFANPAGVIFGNGSIIDVGGLVAAGGNISNSDFLGGINRFTGVEGSVLNYGSIQAGAAALIGRRVANYGSIVGHSGAVMLVAGQDVYLGETGGRMMVRLQGSAPDPAQPGVENAGQIQAAGPVSLGAGDLYSLAVRNEGTIQSKDITVGTGTGTVEVSGTLDAGDAAGQGGQIAVLGQRVGLFGATLDASGAVGGGIIRIGGQYQGGSDLPAAQATYVDGATVIRADATGAGNGGSVVVWSDLATRYYGSISATGGPAGGNGGSAEVSGKQYLLFAGPVNLSAAKGTGGTLLLDPTDVTIIEGAAGGGLLDGSGTGGNPDIYAGAPGLSTLSNGQIEQVLNTGTSLTVRTDGGGADAGNILVDATISKTAGGDATLTFAADNNITVNAGKTIGAAIGALNVSFNAAGDVVLNAAVTTNGGFVQVNGASFTSAPLGTLISGGGDVAINTGAGAASIGGLINAAGGAIDVTAGTIHISTSSIQTSTQDITFTGDVMLGGDPTLSNLLGGKVTITGTVKADAAANTRALLISTGPGIIDLQGAVGGSAGEGVELGSLILIGGQINVPAVRTLGVQIYDGPTTLFADLTASGPLGFTNTATLANNVTINADGDVTFGGAVNADSAANARVLTINAGASGATFASTVGAAQRLGGLNVTAAQLTLTGNVSVTGGGSVNFSAVPVIDLAGNVVIDTDAAGGNASAGNILFDPAGTLDGAFDLTLDSTADGAGAGGTVSLGTIGSAAPLNELTISAAGPVNLTAMTVTTDLAVTAATGDITDSGLVTVGGSAGFTASAADKDITLDQLAVTGPIAVHTTGSGGDAMLVNDGAVDLAASTVGGALTVTAEDGAITDSGTLNIGGAATFSTHTDGGSAITLDQANSTFGTVTAGSLDAPGAAAAAGAIAVRENGTMNLTAVQTTGDASFTASSAIAAASLTNTLGSVSMTAASISVINVTTTGAQSYTGGTTLAGDLTSTTGGAILVTGNTTLAGNVAVTTAGGAADTVGFTGTINADSYSNNRTLSITAGAGDVTLGGNVGGATANNVELNGLTITNTTGDVTTQNIRARTAGSTIAITGDVLAHGAITGATVNLTGDTMNLNGDITAATRLNLAPRTAGRTIDLGTKTAGTLGLTAAELAGITAPVFQIGSSDSGAIDITQPVTFANAQTPTLALLTDGTVTDSGAGALTVTSLRINAAGATLDGAGHVTNLAAAIADGGGLTYHAPLAVRVTTVDGQQGIVTTGGNVSLVTDAGDISADQAIRTTAAPNSGTASGSVTIHAGDGDVTLTAAIDTRGADNAAGPGSNGGAVDIEAGTSAGGAGSATVAAITTSGGTATGARGGDAGSVSVAAHGDRFVDGGGDVVITGNIAALGGNWDWATINANRGAPANITLQPDSGMVLQSYNYLQNGQPLAGQMERPRGRLILGTDSGTAIQLDGAKVSLAAEGRNRISSTATLYAPKGLTVNATEIVMGNNEKLTAGSVSAAGLPDETIDVNLTARAIAGGNGDLAVGDIVSTGDINLTAKRLVFNQRNIGTVLRPDGSRVSDAGLDFVAGRYISIIADSRTNAGQERYGLKDLNPAHSPGVDMMRAVQFTGWTSLLAVTAQGALPPVNRVILTAPAAPTVPANLPLDVAVLGTRQNADPAIAMMGTVPDAWTIEVAPEAPLDDTLARQLPRIGIYTRGLTQGERLERLLASALYNDLGVTMDTQVVPARMDYRVSTGRLSSELARKAMEQYNALFFADTPRGRQYQGPAIAAALQAAINTYATSSNQAFDPAAFKQFLSRGDQHPLAAHCVAQIHELFSTIKLMGLTAIEFDGVCDLLLSDFTEGASILKYKGQPLTRSQVERVIDVGAE